MIKTKRTGGQSISGQGVNPIFLLIGILFLAGNSCFSQTLYEFKYFFNVMGTSNNYQAFLTRYNDGSGFLIARYGDAVSGFSNSAIRMEFEEEYGKDGNGKTDSSLIILRAVDAKVALLESGTHNPGYDDKINEYLNYRGELLCFQKNKQTKFYEPISVFSPYNSSEKNGIIKETNLLNKITLKESLIRQYFSSSDPFYQFIIQERNKITPVLNTGNPKGNSPKGSGKDQANSTIDIDFPKGTGAGSPKDPKITIPGTIKPATAKTISLKTGIKPKLFLVIVANTNDISIGNSCLVDKNATYKTFQQIAEYLKIKLVPKLIFGKTYNKKNVNLALKSIVPSVNDIIVFYYTGHGFNKTEDDKSFPNLDLRAKSFQPYGGANALNIEDVFEQIKKKGARLNLVFSDCCNSDPGQASNTITDIATTRGASLGWKMENCEALFMRAEKQSLLMTAAAKGELSAGNTNIGGIFTFNFRESLEKYMGPFYQDITWEDVMAGVKKQTISKASRTLCPQTDNTYKPCAQTPVFKTE